MADLQEFRLSDKDLDFLIGACAAGVTDRLRLKHILREDPDFRNAFISNENVFRRLMDDDQVLIKISPRLFFEILLRKTAKDLARVSFTLEKTLTMSIPVFDTRDLVEFLAEEPLIIYLADMLSSFTKIESYTFSIRIGEGIWKKIRFNDLDIISLMSFCEAVDDELRMGLFKRIADICLFILGIFPDYVERNYRYPLSGEMRPRFGRKARISPEEYAETGQKFYRLAAEHHLAAQLDLSYVFNRLHDNFKIAHKPLNYIADHYLRYRRDTLFQ